jgi:molybdopterin-guanine dinucleotide biosynthesis protein A
MDVIAAIMAGGESRRMGADKAALRLGDESLLERTARVAVEAGLAVTIVGRERPPEWRGPRCGFLRDQRAGDGPLGGIATALAAANGAAVLALPCDLPALSAAAIGWLLARWRAHGREHGAVALRDGRTEPLFAVYAPAVKTAIDAALARGERSCWRVIAAGGFDQAEVPAEHAAALRDCDTPEDWRRHDR